MARILTAPTVPMAAGPYPTVRTAAGSGSQVVPRPRLETALDGVLGHRLALVVADDGFGKTTLLTSWAAAVNAAVLDVTPADGDLARFARQVLGALRLRVPALGPDLFGSPDPGHPADVSGEERAPSDAMAELLGAALEQHLLRDLALVLDNAHMLGDGPSARFLGSLIRHAPPLLHVVLAGRAAPPVSVERLRRRGEVVELHGADLAFTPEEVGLLLEAVLGAEATDLAVAVHEATAGWPAALRLLIEALREVTPPARAAHIPAMVEDHGRVSELAAVIYDQEPAAIKRLLAAAALFDEVTVELLESLGIDARGPVAALVRRGLFIERSASGAGWYRLHAITAEAVTRRGLLGRKEAARLRVAGADWLAANGLPQAALRVLVAAGRPAEVLALLRASGPELLRGGFADDVVAAVALLPDGPRDPSLERLAGEAYQLQGDWEQALACYARAAPDHGELDPGLAWRMGLIHYLRGQPEAALAAYGRGAIGDQPTRDVALLLAWTASAHWGRGDAEACRRLAVQALRVATEVDDAQALAAAHTVLAMLAAFEGDRRANDAHYRKALQQAERAGDVLQLTRIYTNRGSHFLEEGAYAEALEALDPAIGLADLGGFAGFGALALSNRGEALLGLGRLEEAQADLEAAAAAFDGVGSGMVAYPLNSLGTTAALRGDVDAARRAFERALELSEAAGDVQGQVPALCGLARLLVEEDHACAADLAGRAVAIGTGLGVVAARLATGWVALAGGDRLGARRRAREAANEAEQRRDRPGAAEAITLEAATTDDAGQAVALAERAADLWAELGNDVGVARAALVQADHLDEIAARSTLECVQASMQSIGCRLLEAQATAALAHREPAAACRVRIETLGRLRVLRYGEAVPSSAWKSRKARDLVKILIARRGRAVTREFLVETLWPGETPEEVGNRLNVLLSTIRSVLDPDRRSGADGVVAGDSDAIWLDLDQVDVDVESFLADAAAGLRLLGDHRDTEACAYLLRAEAGYSGDFLEDSPYEDWAVALREEARATYRQVAACLARRASEDADADTAIRYLLRILERDPYDESTHLELVAVLASSGRHGDARRQYRAYSARMDELGVEAAPYRAA